MENKRTEVLNHKLNELSISDTGDTVVVAGNWKGYLLEQQAKKRLEVNFNPPIRSGLDHTPHYEVRCVVTYETRDIVGIGSGANVKQATQNAAKEAAEQWKLIKNIVTENKELQKFYTNLAKNEELAAYLRNDQSNAQTLEKVLSLMGCKSEVVLGNTEKSVLIKIMLRDNENIAVTSVFAVSDRSTDEAKERAEQKAISIIKILITN